MGRRTETPRSLRAPSDDWLRQDGESEPPGRVDGSRGAPAEANGAGAASLDQQIACALQIDPRATWREVARLLKTSESTVARRARALAASGLMRTTALPEPLRLNLGDVALVQLVCSPGGAARVAEALALRADVRFSTIVSGRFDIVAELIVKGGETAARVLAEELPAIPGIVRSTSENVLRTFKSAHDWSRPLLDSAIELPPPRPIDVRAPLEPVHLDPTDLALIDELGRDGRATYPELAERAGISESAARRRVEQLISAGCVTPVTLVDPSFFGYGVEVLTYLRTDLARLEEIANALVARPEVRYLSATSGTSDLVAEVILPTRYDLYRFRTQVLGRMEGIRDVDMALELRTVKRAYLRIGPNGRIAASDDFKE